VNAGIFSAEAVPGPERSGSHTEDKEDDEKASEEEKEIFENPTNHSTVTDLARFLG
jgi:hypothetical protein